MGESRIGWAKLAVTTVNEKKLIKRLKVAQDDLKHILNKKKFLPLKGQGLTVVTVSFPHPILDSPTLQGCLSKMAEWADGWVRKGGLI